MPAHIDSDKILIKDVFSQKWYRVANYQRPYVWGSDQVNELLDDLRQAVESGRETEYFLGSLVLQSIQSGAIQEDFLLDGQQRLTTCLMLHAVGRDLTNDPKLRSSCKEAIFQEANPYDNIPERIRIEFDIREEVRDFISRFLKADGGTNDEAALKGLLISKDASVPHLANAVLEIRHFFTGPEAPNLEAFFKFFRTKVLLIYVSSPQLEDAFRLFTVLNNRGLKLRNSDILKANNLQALRDSNAPEREQREAATLWEELEGELGEDFDAFLAHVRTVLVKEKARLGLFEEFQENIYAPKEFDKATKRYTPKPPLLKPGRDTFEFIKRHRKHYNQILSGNNYLVAGNWEFDNLVTLLNEAGLAEFWVPPLLHYRETFGEHRIIDFLRKLEQKFGGDWIARETPTTRIEGMNAIIKEIDRTRQFAESVEEQVALLLTSPAFHYNYDEYRKQLDTAQIYGRRFARYILYKLDMHFGGVNVRLQPPRLISVEHVLPQTPEESSKWCLDFTLAERELWTDRLGNLVLISGNKNTSQGRLDFQEKKKRYFAKNIEPFPNSLRVLQRNESWTPVDLQRNHAEVLEVLAPKS